MNFIENRLVKGIPYSNASNVLFYFLMAVNLTIGTLLKTNIPLVVQLVLFVLWDYGYFHNRQSITGRPPLATVEHVGLVTTWLSYFVPFYGILFGILFVADTARQKEFLLLCQEAGVPVWLLLIPFMFAALTSIFIPVQLAVKKQENDEEVTSALKSLFCTKIFFSQITIFVFTHCILRLVVALSSRVV